MAKEEQYQKVANKIDLNLGNRLCWLW